MSLLAPLFLVGLAALAVPVLIHLTQRERPNVVAFPSLMFLRRIPYESVRRRRIRDWLLLAVRLAALALVVAAFARPFVRGAPLVAAPGGARDVVLLVDRSYSMSAGETWARARRAAEAAVADLTAADRVSVVLFDERAEVVLRSTPDRSRVAAALAAAEPGAGGTRYGPALALAGSLLAESRLPNRRVILVSDFQRGGWRPDESVRLPEGATLTPVEAAPDAGVNLALTPVTLARTSADGRERVTVTAGILNRGAAGVADVRLSLDLDGRPVQSVAISEVGAGARATASFAPVFATAAATRATVRLAGVAGGERGTDLIARDNIFHFVLSPSAAVPVTLAGMSGRDGAGLYLRRALAIGESPRFAVTELAADALDSESLARTRLVVLHDVAAPEPLAARLAAFVEGGGGLLVATGPRASWPAARQAWLPAAIERVVDRTRGAPARLSAIDFGHIVFEPFRAPRSGDFATARVYGYRAIEPAPGATVVARFDTGEPAVVERAAGAGRVMVVASTLDLTWSDLPLKPVFLPLVHQMARRLGGYREQPAWLTVGQVLDVGAAEAAAGAVHGARTLPIVLTPSGQRVAELKFRPTTEPVSPGQRVAELKFRPTTEPVSSGQQAAERRSRPAAESPPSPSGALELDEQGFYEIRRLGGGASPVAVVAANVSLAESNLDRLDPRELVLAVTGPGGAGPSGDAGVLSDEAQELTQRIWWYLLFAGILLLIAETVLAGRVSRAVR